MQHAGKPATFIHYRKLLLLFLLMLPMLAASATVFSVLVTLPDIQLPAAAVVFVFFQKLVIALRVVDKKFKLHPGISADTVWRHTVQLWCRADTVFRLSSILLSWRQLYKYFALSFKPHMEAKIK